jgi:hypothetical protein
MARCHRIGQTRDVKIYRLVSRDTYEEAVFQTSSKKYGLDEAVLGGMGSAVSTTSPTHTHLSIFISLTHKHTQTYTHTHTHTHLSLILHVGMHHL